MTAQLKKGFTLIELLIVMAILGVLAVVVLVAINPVQQLARTRDAGRKSAITQIGHSLEAYYTSHGATYVPEGITWVGTLATAGELSTVPSAITCSVTGCGTCSTNEQQGWCYNATTAAGGEPAIAYTRLESASETSKCDTGTTLAYFAWATALGRGGLICTAVGEPSVPAAGSNPWNSVQ